MREGLDHALHDVHVEIIKMGTLIEHTIEETIRALVHHDMTLARIIIEGDDRFDDMQYAIENRCVAIIARYQPVATDLRKVFSILKIVTDLERIADHCEDISEITLHLEDRPYVKPLIDIPQMAKTVRKMVRMMINSYIDEDMDAAYEICATDDAVDAYYHSIRRELETVMFERPDMIGQCMDFLMIAKYLERMADHTTNIAEWVMYGVAGER